MDRRFQLGHDWWRRFLSISLGLVFLVAAGQAASPVEARGGAPAGGDTILVQFASNASDQAIAALNGAMATTHVEAIPALGMRVLRVAPGQDAATVAARYARHPLVAAAEVNALVAPGAVPNDPYYGQQWHLARIEASGAWDVARADGVLIGICDTGFDASHPDLAPVLRGDLGWNAVDGSSNWSPIAAHGTYVAGAAAAATNNAAGVAGVAWGANVIPVRISNQTSGSAYVSDAVKCIQYAADRGARAINLSYRMAGYSAIDTAAAYARNRGALTFVAAGNDGVDAGWANFPNFLAVAATTSSDARASYSNYGAYVDIAAPGSSIWTTRTNGAYGTVSGTSMASPVAAGTAALVFGANPALGPAEVEAILRQTAEDLGSAGSDPYFGAGRINAARAVAAAGGSTPPPPPPPDPEPEPEPAPDTTSPTISITAPASGATVSGTVSAGVNAADNVGVTRVDLYLDGTLLATDTSSPYSFQWDTLGSTDGAHTLTARAYDAAGNSGGSAPVTVTIANAEPDAPVTETFTGNVGGTGKKATTSASHSVQVAESGPLDASLTWGGKAQLTLTVLGPTGAVVAQVSATASLEVPAGSYTFVVTAVSGRGSYTLTVTHD
jgi:subtilisin family serine protease